MGIVLFRFSLVVIFVYFLLVVYLLKKKKFLLKYGLLWLFSGLGMLLFILFPNILESIIGMFGIQLASNGLFAMCIFFIVMILLFQTVAVTNFANQIKKLAQRNAIMEKKIRELENKHISEGEKNDQSWNHKI